MSCCGSESATGRGDTARRPGFDKLDEQCLQLPARPAFSSHRLPRASRGGFVMGGIATGAFLPARLALTGGMTHRSFPVRLPLGCRHRRAPERGRQRPTATPGSLEHVTPDGVPRAVRQGRATARSCGARTSTWRRTWASTPTASPSSGRGSSRARATFDEEALDHYEAIVDRCLERGLAPIVTFNHFTSPHWFAMRGGWLDPEAPELFARYCDRRHGALRRPHRARRHHERAQPGPAAVLAGPARLRARPRAGHARGGERGGRRPGVPPGQRDAPRGDGRHAPTA